MRRWGSRQNGGVFVGVGVWLVRFRWHGGTRSGCGHSSVLRLGATAFNSMINKCTLKKTRDASPASPAMALMALLPNVFIIVQGELIWSSGARRRRNGNI